MNWSVALLAAAVGYLLGSISWARVIMRFAAPEEELTGMELDTGSPEAFHVSTVGGTAISVKLGAKYGGLTAILDILKALLPTVAFRLAYPDQPYHLLTATLALVGHNWPLYHGFKGGRGLSPMLGGFFAVDWLGTLLTNVVAMILGLGVLRSVLVTYTAGTWLMVPWLWFRTNDWRYVVYALVVNLLFVVAMIPEVRMMRDRRRRGVQGDFAGSMEAIPMGRMIKQVGARLGLYKERDSSA